MFGRKKVVESKQNNNDEKSSAAVQSKNRGTTAPKGRPTPSRKTAQEANRRPLVPKDRKQARKADRAARDEIWRREQEALRTGDERFLPLSHRGPARKFVRQYIDARFNFSELFLPLVGVLIIVSFFTYDHNLGYYARQIIIALYLYIIVGLVDSLFAGIRAKSLAKRKYGSEALPRRLGFYGFFRSMYPRPMRLPKPTTKRGEYPR